MSTRNLPETLVFSLSRLSLICLCVVLEVLYGSDKAYTVSVSSATDGEMDQFALIHKRWQQLQTLLFLSVALCRHPAATRAHCITLFKSCKKLLALHWIMHCAVIQLTFSPLSFIILMPSFPFLPSPFSQQCLSVCQHWAVDLTTNTLLRISAWASSDWTCKSWIRDTGVTGRTQSSEWDNHSLMHTCTQRERGRSSQARMKPVLYSH